MTNASQSNQGVQQNQENQQNQQHEKPQNELSKDASNLMGKITVFFSLVGNTLNDTVHKYVIDQKISGMKDSMNREANSFREQHPSIKKAAETPFGTVKIAGSYIADTATKIAKSEPVQIVSKSKYNL